MQHFFVGQAMWKHVLIGMFPHLEDKLLLSMMENVETCLYSNVSTFQRKATFQSGPKMWKHVYIEMFPHLKYGTFQPRKKCGNMPI